MRRLVSRLSLLAAVVVCLCPGPGGAGPRPTAAPPAARDPAYCYAVPRLDDVGPTGPAPPVADVDRHPVVPHRSLARSYSRCGLALLVPPIRRFRGTDGGAFAARVAYYRVGPGGCRRPIALRWYGGCRGGTPPSPSTCGRYSHTYHNGSPPMAHALVNASLLVPVGGSRAAAYDYEILVGDRLHVGRLTVGVAPGGPRSPPNRASRQDDRGPGGPAPCRPVAPAAPLWRSIPAAWIVAANPLFNGPEGRRCVSPGNPAEPQDMAYVSAAPQSLLVGLAGYLFALGGRDRAYEPPATEPPASATERSARVRLARGLLSVTTEGTESGHTSAPTAAPAVTNHTETATEGATPPAESSAANGTGPGENGTGEESEATPATPTTTPTAPASPTAPAGNDTEAAGTESVPSDDTTPADAFTPRLEILTARPGGEGGTEGGAGEEEDGGEDDEAEGAGDGELPPAEYPPPATGDAGPGTDDGAGPRPGGRPDSHPYSPTPRRPASRLPPPYLGPLTLRPPSPPAEPTPPSPSPTEAPHTPLFPFLTASPGLDFIFLLSMAAHALAFVVITVMVLRPCRPRARAPSQHRARYTRLATSHA
uniref:Glycoprotein G (Homologue of HSV-2 US4) n=1 Tax=Cercopithecine herpesvirus 1 TaxID=10325 RepID=Q87093_CHV1|nr:glycoprotein G (homologue of HSV-2 US4) [Macacine alphaherpesvirus 1]